MPRVAACLLLRTGSSRRALSALLTLALALLRRSAKAPPPVDLLPGSAPPGLRDRFLRLAAFVMVVSRSLTRVVSGCSASGPCGCPPEVRLWPPMSFGDYLSGCRFALPLNPCAASMVSARLFGTGDGITAASSLSVPIEAPDNSCSAETNDSC